MHQEAPQVGEKPQGVKHASEGRLVKGGLYFCDTVEALSKLSSLIYSTVSVNLQRKEVKDHTESDSTLMPGEVEKAVREKGQRRKGRECCLFWQQDVRSSNSRSHLCVIVWAGAVKFSALTFSSVTQEDKLCLILALSPLTCLWGSCGDAQTGIIALYKIIYKIWNIYKILHYFIDLSCWDIMYGKDLWPSWLS